MRDRGGIRGPTCALLIASVAFSGIPLSAQDPVPPPPAPSDTIRPDSVPPDTVAEGPDTARIVVPPEPLPVEALPDTIAADSVPPDSLLPAPVLPDFPSPAQEGLGAAIWEWDADELQRFHGLSLMDLLRGIPFLTITRAGNYGRPAGVSTFGTGGGRLRVFLDGYELDPLASAVVDLQRLALVDLRNVRLVRGLLETRLELTTHRLEDRRARSYVEAGTGNDDSRLLRGYFSRPIGASNVLTLGLDIVDTRGLPTNEPYSVTTGIVGWDHAFSPDAGVQVEYRQASVDRADETSPVEAGYGQLVVRGRAKVASRLWVDGMIGRGWRSPEEGDSLGLDAESNQSALRVAYVGDAITVGGSGRFRFGDNRGFVEPSSDLSLRTALRPATGIELVGEVRHTRVDSVSGTELTGGLRLGPWLGLSVFATGATGARGVAVGRDSTYSIITTKEPQKQVDGGILRDADTTVIRNFYYPTYRSAIDGFRAGMEWTGWGAMIGGAYVRSSTDLTVPLGLPFDAAIDPVGATELGGIEAYLSTPLIAPPLRVDATYARVFDPLVRPYLPEEQWSVALTYHNLFYTGNLEPTFRLEALHRGQSLAPTPDVPEFSTATAPYTLVNLFVQIRILDVQAFLRWENLLDVEGVDVPGHPFAEPRALYGVRWSFYN